MNQLGENAGQTPDEVARSDQRILRMTPDGKTASSVDAILRNRINELVDAIRHKDIDRLMSFYASDVVVFDVRPPLDVHGAAGYRQNFERWFESFEGQIAFDFVELRVAPGEFTSFCHYLALVVGSRPEGRKSGYWIRGTTCFERRDGEWLVTHEHISMPSAQG
jgi:ketosteroid isomerase-like protein